MARGSANSLSQRPYPWAVRKSPYYPIFGYRICYLASATPLDTRLVSLLRSEGRSLAFGTNRLFMQEAQVFISVRLTAVLVALLFSASHAHSQGMGLLDVTYYQQPALQSPSNTAGSRPGYVVFHGASNLGHHVLVDVFARYRSHQPIPSLGEHIETCILATADTSSNEYMISLRSETFAGGHMLPLAEVRLLFVARTGIARFATTTDVNHSQLRSFQRELEGVKRLKVIPETQTAAPIWTTGEMLDPGLFLMSTISGAAYRIDLEMGTTGREPWLPQPPPIGPVSAFPTR